MCLPLLPIALEAGHSLMFPVVCAIGLIGAAPAFKSSTMEYWAHMIGSYVSVGLGLLVFALSYKLYLLTGIEIALVLALYYELFNSNQLKNK